MRALYNVAVRSASGVGCDSRRRVAVIAFSAGLLYEHADILFTKEIPPWLGILQIVSIVSPRSAAMPKRSCKGRAPFRGATWNGVPAISRPGCSNAARHIREKW